jgi:hypothetical protein
LNTLSRALPSPGIAEIGYPKRDQSDPQNDPGAPFWFNVLQRFVQLRGTGRPRATLAP